MLKNNGGANSSWFSRNMILSGSVILAFWDCIFMTSGCQKWFTRWSESIGFYKILPRTSGEIWKSSPYRNLLCVICPCPYTCCMVSILQCSQLVSNKYSKALHKLDMLMQLWFQLDSFSLHYFIISIIIFNYNGIRLKIPNGPISDKWTNYKNHINLLILQQTKPWCYRCWDGVSWRFCFRNISRIRI
jgi:hypothetical protein